MTKVKNVVMLGFGDMGKGIAQVCLMAGYKVIAVDVSDEIIQKGLEYNKTGFEKLEAKGREITRRRERIRYFRKFERK